MISFVAEDTETTKNPFWDSADWGFRYNKEVLSRMAAIRSFWLFSLRRFLSDEVVRLWSSSLYRDILVNASSYRSWGADWIQFESGLIDEADWSILRLVVLEMFN